MYADKAWQTATNRTLKYQHSTKLVKSKQQQQLRLISHSVVFVLFWGRVWEVGCFLLTGWMAGFIENSKTTKITTTTHTHRHLENNNYSERSRTPQQVTEDWQTVVGMAVNGSIHNDMTRKKVVAFFPPEARVKSSSSNNNCHHNSLLRNLQSGGLTGWRCGWLAGWVTRLPNSTYLPFFCLLAFWIQQRINNNTKNKTYRQQNLGQRFGYFMACNRKTWEKKNEK